jgi:hypothetical protein
MSKKLKDSHVAKFYAERAPKWLPPHSHPYWFASNGTAGFTRINTRGEMCKSEGRKPPKFPLVHTSKTWAEYGAEIGDKLHRTRLIGGVMHLDGAEVTIGHTENEVDGARMWYFDSCGDSVFIILSRVWCVDSKDLPFTWVSLGQSNPDAPIAKAVLELANGIRDALLCANPFNDMSWKRFDCQPTLIANPNGLIEIAGVRFNLAKVWQCPTL